MKPKGAAELDAIYNGQAHGSLAEKLIHNNMDVSKLRTNAVLTYDEWKDIDRVVIQEATIRLNGVADLMSRGLQYNTKGLGATVLQWQDASDVDDAELNMDGITRGQRDRQEFDTNYLPLPIAHKDFSFTAREIAASRNQTAGNPLDTTNVALATRKVTELVEQMLFRGYSSYNFGGGTIYGYEDFTNRNTGSMTASWTASAASGTTIKNDVLNMKQAMINDRMYGPYIIYIPTAYEKILDDDYNANYGKSIRSRLLEIDNIVDIKVADQLTANNVVMVQLTSDVVRMVQGLALTTLQWDTEGGMKTNFKVMAILVPQIRATQANRCGIVHYT